LTPICEEDTDLYEGAKPPFEYGDGKNITGSLPLSPQSESLTVVELNTVVESKPLFLSERIKGLTERMSMLFSIQKEV